ncbi:MAG TPA: YkgJ family cysteine cluster protein [Geobacteraceae bacterium]
MLTGRVDELCRRIAAEYAEHLACRPGCDGCCRHISIFPVEAAALASAMKGLAAENASRVRDRARASAGSEACPLLGEDGRCVLYGARPIICRTHGYPILTRREEGRSIDFCPKNFVGVGSLPASLIIDLEVINTTLAAVNSVFLSSCPGFPLGGKERLTVAEALLLED